MNRCASAALLVLIALPCGGCGPSGTSSRAPGSPPAAQSAPRTLTFADGYVYVAWNTRRAPWKSAEVRRSMTSFIDRKALALQLAGDARAVAESPVPPADPRHDPTVLSPPFDPGLAAHGLRDAGLSRIGTGPWTLRGGTPVRLTILCGQGDLARRTAAAVADALTQSGFSVEARALPDQDLGTHLASGDYDAVVLFRPPGQALDLAAEFGSESPANPTRFSDGPLDALLAGGEATFAEACRRIVELQPRMFLFYLRV